MGSCLFLPIFYILVLLLFFRAPAPHLMGSSSSFYPLIFLSSHFIRIASVQHWLLPFLVLHMVSGWFFFFFHFHLISLSGDLHSQLVLLNFYFFNFYLDYLCCTYTTRRGHVDADTATIWCVLLYFWSVLCVRCVSDTKWPRLWTVRAS